MASALAPGGSCGRQPSRILAAGDGIDNAICDEGTANLGLHITHSADLEQARWLVRTADAQTVRAATHDLSSRRKPRPMKVIAYLGLERRKIPRPGLPAPEAIAAHQHRRLTGWGPEPDNSAR